MPSPDVQAIQMIHPALPALPIQYRTSAYSHLYHPRALRSHFQPRHPCALPHVHARATTRPDHSTHRGAHHHARAHRTHHMASASALFASVAGAAAAHPKEAVALEHVWVPVPAAWGLASVVEVL